MIDGTLARATRFLPDSRHFLAILLGALFAVGLYQIWSLDGLYFYAAIIAIIGLSLLMFFIGVYRDFLTLCFFYAIPFAGMGLWMFPGNLRMTVWSDENHNASLEGALGVGPLDFIVAFLLLSWFGRIFVLREQPLPKLNVVDAFIFVLLAAYILSVPDSPKPNLGLHAIAFLLKYILLYFYFSRNLTLKHIQWFVVSMVFIIVLEGVLGIGQHFFGKFLGLGLGRTDYEYEVFGLEGYNRAAGTLYDSHTLGLYLAMMTPFMYVLAFANFLRPFMKMVYAGAMMFALITLLETFTRSAWVAGAVSMSLLVAASIFVWKERQVVPLLVLMMLVAVLSAPWSLDLIIERVTGFETLSGRIEGYIVGLDIWSKYPVFGVGAGNYIEALWLHNFGWNQDIIVHNTVIWLGSTVGVLGVIGFYGAIFVVMRKAWRIGKDPSDLVGRCGFAIVFALLAFVVEGMATPMHREPASFAMFWFLLALAVALERIRAEQISAAENHG